MIGFVTPVYRRHDLTRLCMMQRRRMIDRLREHGIEATAILVGDEPEHKEVALTHGFEWVEHDNSTVALKWNAGYAHARKIGCTHVMAIGSDSWLDPEMIAAVPLHPDQATAITGLSAFKEDGTERFDLFIRYPAGFGVGMIYPMAALPDDPVEPTKDKGSDSSCWRRSNLNASQVDFRRLEKCTYLNFASPDVQITPYKNLNVHRRVSLLERRPAHVFGDLLKRFDADLVEAIEGFYAARSIGAFLTGETREEAKVRAQAERRARVVKRTGRPLARGSQGAR
jgi:hypothetical protein